MPVKYLGVVTGAEFQTEYNKMESLGMQPKASTVIPIKDNDDNENTALFHVWVFYNKEVKVNKLQLSL